MSDYPHNIPFNNGWHFDLTQYSKRFESAIWDLFGQAPDEDQSVLVMSYIPNREGKGPECVTADTSTKVENELESHKTLKTNESLFYLIEPIDDYIDPLAITPDLAKRILSTYEVRPPFIDCLLSIAASLRDVARISTGSAIYFNLSPILDAQPIPLPSKKASPSMDPRVAMDSYEISYTFSYLAQNNIDSEQHDSNHDWEDWWSMRTTAVVQQYRAATDSNSQVWIIAKPPPDTDARLKESLKTQGECPLYTHLVLLSSAGENWGRCFYDLEERAQTIDIILESAEDLITQSTEKIHKLQRFAEFLELVQNHLHRNASIIRLLVKLNKRFHELNPSSTIHQRVFKNALYTALGDLDVHIRNYEGLFRRIRQRTKLYDDRFARSNQSIINQIMISGQKTATKQAQKRDEQRRKERYEDDRQRYRDRLLAGITYIFIPLGFVLAFQDAGIFSFDEDYSRPFSWKRISISQEGLVVFFVMSFAVTALTGTSVSLWTWYDRRRKAAKGVAKISNLEDGIVRTENMGVIPIFVSPKTALGPPV